MFDKGSYMQKILLIIQLISLCSLSLLHAMEQEELMERYEYWEEFKYWKSLPPEEQLKRKKPLPIEELLGLNKPVPYGLQGCVNKAICGEQGFYLYRYSPEGLCSQCEFKSYPERFIACLFCRQPAEKANKGMSTVCFSCLPLEDILVKKLVINDEWRQKESLSIGISKYWRKAEETLQRRYIKSFISSRVRNDIFDEGLTRSAHIYLGAQQLKNGNLLHVWSKEPMIDPSDKKYVATWDEAEKHAEYIFKKYDLFGPETGATMTQEIPAQAFTYEEVIDQQ